MNFAYCPALFCFPGKADRIRTIKCFTFGAPLVGNNDLQKVSTKNEVYFIFTSRFRSQPKRNKK